MNSLYNKPKIYTVSELPSNHILRKLKYYPCDGEVMKQIKFDFKKYSVGGKNTLNFYFENKHEVEYIKIVKKTSKSIYIRVYYSPRKEYYRGFFCDYEFKVLHVLGGCRLNFVYIYTLVLKNKNCDRAYQKSIWSLYNENFEIVIHRINIETGEIAKTSYYNELPKVLDGLDYIDSSNKMIKLREEGLKLLTSATSKILKNIGVVTPENFIPFDYSAITGYSFDRIKIPGKFNNVDIEFIINYKTNFYKKLYDFKIVEDIIMQIQKLAGVFNKFKQMMDLEKAKNGIVIIEMNSSLSVEYKLYYDGFIAFKFSTIELPTVVGGAYNILVTKAHGLDLNTLEKVLKTHLIYSGVSDLNNINILMKFIKTFPPSNEGYLIYFKEGEFGIYGDSTKRVIRIYTTTFDNFINKILEYLYK